MVGPLTLRELAERLGGILVGDGELLISDVGSLDDGVAGQITFLANPKYAAKVATTAASAVIAPAGTDLYGKSGITLANPYLGFAQALMIFHGERPPARGVLPGAILGQEVRYGAEVTIHPGAVLGDRVRLGDRVTIHPGVVLYDDVELGDDVVLHANVTVRERCRLGNRVTVHSGTVIGGDGFGYAPEGGRHVKIPQVGIVVLEDDVEVGANVAIDRAALGVTRIGRGTKIDNLVQIAHNVQIGEDCIVAGQVGIAGSTVIGRRVSIGGQVGVTGHIRIVDNVMIGAKSGVMGHVDRPGVFSGMPILPHKEWLKVSGVFTRLPVLRRTIHELEKRVAALEGGVPDTCGDEADDA